MSDSKLVDISAELKHETDRAYLINDGTSDVWLPKSQVEKAEVRAEGIPRQTIFEFTMPEWLAKDKGLI